MLYVKKAVPINAQQIINGQMLEAWLQPYIGDALDQISEGVYKVHTNHGWVDAKTGDWILQAVDGEIYPCSDETFRATYACVEAPSIYPAVDSFWRHHNGNIYRVLSIANSEGDDPSKRDKYPVTVVYRGVNGKIWARPYSLWHASMTLAEAQ